MKFSNNFQGRCSDRYHSNQMLVYQTSTKLWQSSIQKILENLTLPLTGRNESSGQQVEGWITNVHYIADISRIRQFPSIIPTSIVQQSLL